MIRVLKYWQHIALSDKEDVVNKCLQFQINTSNAGDWANRVKDELRRIGLTTIWEEQENLGSRELRRIRTRCNGIERQNMFAKISEKTSLTDYVDENIIWGREE
jgi:hypothetical protein